MRYYFLLFSFVVVSFGYSQTASDPLNVLFVGNSLTYYNDIPQIFEEIAEEQGYHINLDQHTMGGTGFADHLFNADLDEKFNSLVWDYVILQPGTAESVEYSQSIEFTIYQAEQLRDKIYVNSPCASIYLYETAYGIVNDSPAELQQFLEVQELIKSNLIQMSNQTGLPMVPVGETFQTSIQQNPEYFLWVNYGDIHQNDKGAFLAACTFFNAIFQKPISNSIVNSTLSSEEANYFRNIAETVTLNELESWNISTYTATADFTFSSSDGYTVNFVNESSNFDSVIWNFGDGIYSTEINPIHQFDFLSQNSFQVYLTAFLGCKESHFNQIISQNSLDFHDLNLDRKFVVFPNPSYNECYIKNELGEEYGYILTDTFGKIINSERNLVANHFIDTSKLLKGIYIITIKSNTLKETFKLLKL